MKIGGIEIKDSFIWMGFGFLILGFLVITTPGWQDVLGLTNFSLDLGGLDRYVPALILLGFMTALVVFVLLGGEKKESK